jgi:hypothetical protein
MATKINIMKFLQEADGYAEIEKRPVPPKPALYLMQMRSRAHQPALPRIRLPIRIDPRDYSEPLPVKIILLKPDSEA